MKTTALFCQLLLLLCGCHSTEPEAGGAGDSFATKEPAAPTAESVREVQRKLGAGFPRRAGRVEMENFVIYAIGIGPPAAGEAVKKTSLRVSAPFVVTVENWVIVSGSPDSWFEISGRGISWHLAEIFGFGPEWRNWLKPGS